MRVRFCGLGGQGVVVSGIIYANAAMVEGFEVLQGQSYGSTTRGGVTTADVTLDRSTIYELECPDFDVIIALCQEANDKFQHLLVEGGTLITEKSLVDVDPDSLGSRKHIAVPALEMAREDLGRQILANIVMLGALSKLVETVPEASLIRAIESNVPKGTEQLNRKAFAMGRKLAQ
jgi:2-oxoglutarate ferredoxin oxidoreductase subunit gamma